MKKFIVNAIINNSKAPLNIYIGNPKQDLHPLYFQSRWLSEIKGGNFEEDTMYAIDELKKIAYKYNIALENLCVYALGVAKEKNK